MEASHRIRSRFRIRHRILNFRSNALTILCWGLHLDLAQHKHGLYPMLIFAIAPREQVLVCRWPTPTGGYRYPWRGREGAVDLNKLKLVSLSSGINLLTMHFFHLVPENSFTIWLQPSFLCMQLHLQERKGNSRSKESSRNSFFHFSLTLPICIHVPLISLQQHHY